MGHEVRKVPVDWKHPKRAHWRAGRCGSELVLRTCNPDMTAFGGFLWPEAGPVEAPDWDPNPRCGGGLHGFLRGEGNGELVNWDHDAKWLVVEVDGDDVVDLDGNVKFPRGKVLYSGAQEEATRIIQERYPGAAVIGATATAGYRGTATVGDRGTATAGRHSATVAGNDGTSMATDYGTATAGHRGSALVGHGGTAKAGDFGNATAGDDGIALVGIGGRATVGHGGTATAGEVGTATAGSCGAATAGYRGTATVGRCGVATAGLRGIATAGCHGTATVGDYGTATVGYRGTATAGDGGTIMIQMWDGARYRHSIGYVGEDGIEANVAYKLDGGGGFVRATEVAE